MIQAALDRAGGNISETARALGLTRRGLYLKLRRLGLDARAEVDTRLSWILNTQFTVLAGYQVSMLHRDLNSLHNLVNYCTLHGLGRIRPSSGLHTVALGADLDTHLGIPQSWGDSVKHIWTDDHEPPKRPSPTRTSARPSAVPSRCRRG